MYLYSTRLSPVEQSCNITSINVHYMFHCFLVLFFFLNCIVHNKAWRNMKTAIVVYFNFRLNGYQQDVERPYQYKDTNTWIN